MALSRDLEAYNHVIEALNEADVDLDRIAEQRDRLWLAAEAIAGTRTHGKAGRERDLAINGGVIQ